MSLDRALVDVERFTQAGFAVDLVFTAPTAETSACRGLASKHRISINPDTGNPTNSPNTHVSAVESVILAANAEYPTRNASGEIYLKGHKVLYNGITYKISEQWPDETLGLIVCILKEFE